MVTSGMFTVGLLGSPPSECVLFQGGGETILFFVLLVISVWGCGYAFRK